MSSARQPHMSHSGPPRTVGAWHVHRRCSGVALWGSGPVGLLGSAVHPVKTGSLTAETRFSRYLENKGHVCISVSWFQYCPGVGGTVGCTNTVISEWFWVFFFFPLSRDWFSSLTWVFSKWTPRIRILMFPDRDLWHHSGGGGRRLYNGVLYSTQKVKCG